MASRRRAERSGGGLLTPEVINKSVSSRTPVMSRAELVHLSLKVNQGYSKRWTHAVCVCVCARVYVCVRVGVFVRPHAPRSCFFYLKQIVFVLWVLDQLSDFIFRIKMILILLLPQIFGKTNVYWCTMSKSIFCCCFYPTALIWKTIVCRVIKGSGSPLALTIGQ